MATYAMKFTFIMLYNMAECALWQIFFFRCFFSDTFAVVVILFGILAETLLHAQQHKSDQKMHNSHSHSRTQTIHTWNASTNLPQTANDCHKF